MSPTPSLITRVAIVTGAAQGIGRAIALRLARDGFDVALNDLPSKTKELESAVDEIQSFGRKGLSVPGDASKEEFLTNLVDTTVKKLGSLDVVSFSENYPLTPICGSNLILFCQFVANAGVVGRKEILDSQYSPTYA